MNAPIALSADDARRILALEPGKDEIDLPWARLSVEVAPNSVMLGGYEIGKKELELAKSANVLYAPIEGRLRKIQFFQDRLYKLVPTGGYPALEIDGVRMHRTKDMLPEAEARLKIRCLGLHPGLRVLDICTGLGYSAQEAARRGTKVLTIEMDPAVLKLARRNPCSVDFFNQMKSMRVWAVISDASRFIEILDDGSFDRILNDPPTFSLAGELYSSRFYGEVRRIIKDNGILLHYTGQPGSRYRRRDLRRGVSKRLAKAGFKTRWVERARSILARPITSN